MKNLLSSLLFISISTISFSQQVIDWQKTYGGSGSDIAKDVIQNTDGDYVVVGYTSSTDGDVSTNAGNFDGWIVKVSPTGTILWEFTFGGSSNDLFFDVNQTSDGGYIIAGTTISNNGDITGNNGNSDAWVVKLSSLGALEWSTVYGGFWDENGNAIIQTSDGGYILAADSGSEDGDVTANNSQGSQQFQDYWIVKLTATGGISWERNYGGTMSDWTTDIKQKSNGNYLISGHVSTGNVDVNQSLGGTDIWVIELDDQGNLVTQKSLGDALEDRSKKIFLTSDGGYVVGGNSDSGGLVNNNHGEQDFWVVKVNSAGTIEWNNSYGGSSFENMRGMAQTASGGFILTGTTTSSDGDITSSLGSTDLWTIEINSLGVKLWEKSVGGTNHEYGESIIQAADGNFLAAGFTESNDGDVTVNQGASDFWLVKFEGASTTGLAKLSTIVSIYPNPTEEYLNISLSEASSISITDVNGKQLLNSEASNMHQINVAHLEAGIYIIKTENGASSRFIKN